MLWKRIKRWVMEWLGIEPSAVKLGDRVFAPLFYVTQTGGTAATWDYLNKSEADQKHCRETILNLCHGGETPAIVFLLTPSYEAGNIFTPFPNVINPANLDKAVDAILECLWDGIAVIPCLYTDDQRPLWYEIESHMDTWRAIHSQISKYVTGYVLSIESNEEVSSVGELQHCIHLMKTCMPDKIYGCHLQYKGKSRRSNYRWNSLASTPNNIDFVLVENSWTPYDGDKNGVVGLQKEFAEITAFAGSYKLLWHEFNINPSSEIFNGQRSWLRSQKIWGVG